MSRQEEPLTPKEEGGIVTTVVAEESQDVDFQRKLRERRGESDEVVAKEEPVVARSDDDDNDDDENWQKNLTPRQQREVNKLYRERKTMTREHRDITERQSARIAELEKLGGQRQPEARVARQAQVLERPTEPDPLDPKYKDEAAYKAAKEKYEDDLFDFRKNKEKAEQREAEQARQNAASIDRFNDMVDKFSADEPTYADTMDDADNEVSDLMFGAIMEEGPQLGFYWAKHPEESAKIARLSLRDEKAAIKLILRRVIKLEDEAEAAKEKVASSPPKTPQKQQEPPKQVGGGKTVVVPKDRTKMTFKEREKQWAKDHPGALNYQP